MTWELRNIYSCLDGQAGHGGVGFTCYSVAPAQGSAAPAQHMARLGRGGGARFLFSFLTMHPRVVTLPVIIPARALFFSCATLSSSADAEGHLALHPAKGEKGAKTFLRYLCANLSRMPMKARTKRLICTCAFYASVYAFTGCFALTLFCGLYRF